MIESLQLLNTNHHQVLHVQAISSDFDLRTFDKFYLIQIKMIRNKKRVHISIRWGNICDISIYVSKCS